MANYRKIWIENNGPIPRDEYGFSYEIHHKDGNRSNNTIQNLLCVSIQEHLDIHLSQGDWGAASFIAKRIGLGPTYSSDIQKGKKRPGIGGVPKGTIPWNKGGRHSEHTKQKLRDTRKGKRYTAVKITDHRCLEIIQKYHTNFYGLDLNPVKSKNGRILTYSRLFAKIVSKEFGVCVLSIENIIKGHRNVI